MELDEVSNCSLSFKYRLLINQMREQLENEVWLSD